MEMTRRFVKFSFIHQFVTQIIMGDKIARRDFQGMFKKGRVVPPVLDLRPRHCQTAGQGQRGNGCERRPTARPRFSQISHSPTHH